MLVKLIWILLMALLMFMFHVRMGWYVNEMDWIAGCAHQKMQKVSSSYAHMLILHINVCIPGPCVRARLDDSTLNCDEDGNYEALQCRKNADSQLIVCRCVDPNGSEVSGTEVSLTDSSDDFVPNCDRGR